VRAAIAGRWGSRLAAVAAAFVSVACGADASVAPVVVVPPVAPPAATEAPASSATARGRDTSTAGPIRWETSEPGARALARRKRVPFLVYACAEWSVPCRELDRKVWSAPEVVAAASRFVALRLDLTSADGDAELYAQRYDVTAVPMIVLFDAEGRKIVALRGFVGAAELASELGRVADR
jgi:thiol:disulfide interchange protein